MCLEGVIVVVVDFEGGFIGIVERCGNDLKSIMNMLEVV